MFAPALMASDAHVCLSSCGVMTGNSGVTASPVALISSWRFAAAADCRPVTAWSNVHRNSPRANSRLRGRGTPTTRILSAVRCAAVRPPRRGSAPCGHRGSWCPTRRCPAQLQAYAAACSGDMANSAVVARSPQVGVRTPWAGLPSGWGGPSEPGSWSVLPLSSPPIESRFAQQFVTYFPWRCQYVLGLTRWPIRR